jgi:hypothetical protein
VRFLLTLTTTYPAIKGQLLNDDGTLHRFLNVYVNDDDVRYLGGVDSVGRQRRRDHAAARRGGRRLVVARYASVLDLIGNTPMVDVSALYPNPTSRILMKLEGRIPAAR